MRKLVALLIILVTLFVIWNQGAKYFPQLSERLNLPENAPSSRETLRVVEEENWVIDVVKRVGPSVVAIGIDQSSQSNRNPGLGPFSLFFDDPVQNEDPRRERYIGTGFVVRSDGLIVSNKHVVSETDITYVVVDDKGNKYEIDRIYRDPLNDLAIIKVKSTPAGGFPEAKLGDSTRLQVGQFAVAIGTALGEFRNTVTTGVISGLGRGITAGSPFEGYVERLDNVIQTDAAINPGNSGGPLLNSAGQVIGVNTAIASSGQNIGFAIPINVVKDSLKNFNETGQFNRPYLGVAYTIINRRTALLNDLPEGAYVREVIEGSSADKAGVTAGDIITKIDGQKITDQDGGLAAVISKKKVGETVTITVFRTDGSGRNEQTLDLKATLEQAPGQ